jgi:hypothetical protein
MIKKFEEFISESFIKEGRNYPAYQAPYILFIEHLYSDHKYSGTPTMREMSGKERIEMRKDMKRIAKLAEENGKAVMTSDDIEDIGFDDFMTISDNQLLLYPFNSYEEAKEFISEVVNGEGIRVGDFDLFTTTTRDIMRNPLLYKCRGLKKEDLEEIMSSIVQCFTDRM